MRCARPVLKDLRALRACINRAVLRWKTKGGELDMTKDPVCSMMVDEKTAKFKSQYGGKTYYFCAQGCKATFDKNPAKFVRGQ